jgi:hypothetical protein
LISRSSSSRTAAASCRATARTSIAKAGRPWYWLVRSDSIAGSPDGALVRTSPKSITSAVVSGPVAALV